jgi:DNA polymerase subunit Cdc27
MSASEKRTKSKDRRIHPATPKKKAMMAEESSPTTDLQLTKDIRSLLNDQQRCVSVSKAMRLGVSRFRLAALLQSIMAEDDTETRTTGPLRTIRVETTTEQTEKGIPVTGTKKDLHANKCIITWIDGAILTLFFSRPVFHLRKSSAGQNNNKKQNGNIYAITRLESLAAAHERHLAELRDRTKDRRLVAIAPEGILPHPKYTAATILREAAESTTMTDNPAPQSILQQPRKPITAESFFKTKQGGKENKNQTATTTTKTKKEEDEAPAAATATTTLSKQPKAAVPPKTTTKTTTIAASSKKSSSSAMGDRKRHAATNDNNNNSKKQSSSKTPPPNVFAKKSSSSTAASAVVTTNKGRPGASTTNSKKATTQAPAAAVGTVDDFQGDMDDDDDDDDSSVEEKVARAKTAKPRAKKAKTTTTKVIHDVDDDTPPPPGKLRPAAKAPVGPPAKRRRKVQKTRHTLDEKGYMITEYYEEWDDIPTDEEEEPVIAAATTKTTAATTTTAKGKKKSRGSGSSKPTLKQGSLNAFIKKKG